MNSDDVVLAALSVSGEKALLEAGGVRTLLDTGKLEDIIKRPQGALKKLGLAAAENNLNRAEKCGAEILSILNPAYPALLKEIPNPPLILFVRGKKECLNEFCIGIVGSRKSSRAGINIAAQIARDLARCGVTVVSGFAFGADISAHLAAAELGSTAAVLGSGFEHIYPKEHIKYLDKVCENGCILTEFMPSELPAPYNFPKRNRIISGLSKGIIVCEASKKSGSLITARLALEQNRDVFAVPASPSSFNNTANRLIKEGAVLTESYLDVINEYKDIFADICVKEDAPPYSPPEEHREVWERLKTEPLSADELAQEVDYGKLILSITALEIEGVIERNAEGRYSVVKTHI